MVVLRCSRELLVRLERFDDGARVRSTTRLGSWHGTILRMGRRHALVFISESAGVPILLPMHDANRLSAAFAGAVCQMLAFAGVSAANINDERARMSDMAFGEKNGPHTSETLNEVSLSGRMQFITRRDLPLDEMARLLASTPVIALNRARPIDVARGLFKKA